MMDLDKRENFLRALSAASQGIVHARMSLYGGDDTAALVNMQSAAEAIKDFFRRYPTPP